MLSEPTPTMRLTNVRTPVLLVCALLFGCSRSSAEGPAAPNDKGDRAPEQVEVVAPEAPPKPDVTAEPGEVTEKNAGEPRSEAKVKITEAEAKSMHRQLLERLEGLDEEERKQVLAWAQKFAFSDRGDGTYYLAGFILSSDGEALVLERRGTEHAWGFVIYRLPVVRDGANWKVGPLETARVHRRR